MFAKEKGPEFWHEDFPMYRMSLYARHRAMPLGKQDDYIMKSCVCPGSRAEYPQLHFPTRATR